MSESFSLDNLDPGLQHFEANVEHFLGSASREEVRVFIADKVEFTLNCVSHTFNAMAKDAPYYLDEDQKINLDLVYDRLTHFNTLGVWQLREKSACLLMAFINDRRKQIEASNRGDQALS